eukprot:SAG22_NODE_1385_length_4533_cov_11.714253_3_plen_253_part_01
MVAKFLESQGRKEMALELATDIDYKFELAISLSRLEIAYEIAAEKHSNGIDVTSKWRQLADLSLVACKVDLAEECMLKAGDLAGLVLLYSSMGKKDGMLEVAAKAKAAGKTNVAFMCFFLCGQTEACVDLLCQTNRVPEAALFARTYAPSLIGKVLPLWRKELADAEQPKLADALADPNEYANLFPNWETALLAEQLVEAREARPGTDYPFVDEDEDPMAAAEAALGDLGGDDDGAAAATGGGDGDDDDAAAA